MKVVCAWCNKIITDGDEPVSHGICKDCVKAIKEEETEISGEEETKNV